MPLDLTGAQVGILRAQQLDPRNSAFVIAEYLELAGALDVEHFVVAVRTMIAETDATRVRAVAGERQELRPGSDVPMDVVDVRDRPDPEGYALAAMRADLATPLDPAVDTLCRHILFRIGPERFLWYHRAHHFALDGYAFALIAARVAALYRAFSTDSAPLPAATHSLADVVDEYRDYLGSADRLTDRAYWMALLSNLPTAPSLSNRHSLPTNTFRRSVSVLEESEFVALTAASRSARVVWSDLLLAVVAATTARETDVRDVALGLPVSNRLGSCAVDVPCMVLGAITVPVRVEPSHTLASIARAIADQLRRSRKHSRYRYEDVRAETGALGGDRRLFGPVVNIMAFDYALDFPGVDSTAHNLTPGPVEDITIDIYRRSTGSGLTVCIDANPRRYSDDDVARIHRVLTTVLTAAIADPHTRADDLTRRIVPIGAVESGRAIDTLSTIAALADADPSAPALVGRASQGWALSRSELVDAARAVAAAIADAAPTADIVVFSPFGHGRDVVVMLAAHLLNVPYCVLDADAPDLARRLDAIGHLDIAVVCDSSTGTALADRATVVEYPAGQTLSQVHSQPAAPSGDAYLVFTSGSTGTPKAITVSRENLNAFVAGVSGRYAVDHRDRVLQFAPLHADTSVEEIFVTLTAGATLVVATPEEKRSLSALMELVDRESVTVLDLPTALWHELVVGLELGVLALPDSVRTVIIGGEAASADRVRQWHRSAGNAPVRLINTYGPSEATVVATTAELDNSCSSGTSAPIGRPIPTVGAVLLVDIAEADRTGELCLYGPTVARYASDGVDKELSFDALTLDRGTADERTVHGYRTGDLVTASDDGTLTFVGRIDDQAKISGYRVVPSGIDEMITGLPGVAGSSTVIADRGGVTPTVHSFVVCTDGELTPTDIRAQLDGILPVGSRPRSITVVDTLPLTGNGKVDRAALLAQLLADPPPAVASHHANATEAAIVAVWAEVTGAFDVGVDSDFFLLGGSSMHTIAAANRLSAAVGVDVRPGTIFANPTPRALARELDEETAEPSRDDQEILDDLDQFCSWPKHFAPKPHGEARHVLLTGSTGFVGRHVLRELLGRPNTTVTVLVRSSDTAAADNLHILVGDLKLPRFGLDPEQWQALAENVTDVINCAAVVSPLRRYPSVRAVNTVAVSELLTLCRIGGRASFHQISTVGVQSSLPTREFASSGYLASKAVAEEITRAAAESGMHSSVIRLGRVLGPRSTGAVNPDDTLWNVIGACLSTGCYPDVAFEEPLSCVDEVATAIVELVLDSDRSSTVTTIGPPRRTSFGEIVHAVGLDAPPFRAVSLEHWRRAVGTSDSITPEHRQLIALWAETVGSCSAVQAESPTTASYRTLPEIAPDWLRRWARG